SPHPRAKEATNKAADIVLQAAIAAGAPKVAGDGFARRRESVKVKNVIGIDTAKDDKFACSFHHFCSRESPTSVSQQFQTFGAAGKTVRDGVYQ
ncbi:hypothetical protein, partial [Klebsiella pneumoniae]|uniref:hypothetical protein n=1 Tax=Klebsiella pneumoniae TaxID=573 RepID=UPI003F7A4AAB